MYKVNFAISWDPYVCEKYTHARERKDSKMFVMLRVETRTPESSACSHVVVRQWALRISCVASARPGVLDYIDADVDATREGGHTESFTQVQAIRR